MAANHADTFPRLLAELAASRPSDTALQEKRYGIWSPLSWREYAERVRDFAHGLAALGVERGDVVAVLGDNRPEWLIAELAAQSIGASVVGIYPTSIGEELRHILSLARVEVVVAEDQEQVDKLIRLRGEERDADVPVDLPPVLVQTVIYYDPHGLSSITGSTPSSCATSPKSRRSGATGAQRIRAGSTSRSPPARPGTSRSSARRRARRAGPSSPSCPTPTCSRWPSTSPRSTRSAPRTATCPSCPSRGSASRCSRWPAG